MGGVAGIATGRGTGNLSVGVTASKCASGRKSNDIKSDVWEVLCVRAFCKHCDKLGIAKEEDEMLFLVMGRQFEHSRRCSAQRNCSS